MKHFKTQKKIQEASYVFIVNYITNQKEKERLLEVFNQLDENGDGQLSREELINGFRDIIKSDNPEEDAEHILKEVDKNNTGFIDYHEFVLASINKKNILTKQSLTQAFNIIDKDGSGSISVDELKITFGDGISDKVWEEIIREADENNDGEIQFDEFKNIMLKLLEEK